MLEVKEVSATYGQHRALNKASLRVGKGEIVVILGANGAGKSTLLKAISGICEGKITGSIHMQGEEITRIPPNRVVEMGIALVPEGRGVFGDLSVAENLTLGAYTPRARPEEDGNLERVMRLFPKLVERRGQIVRTMSGGEQQMVAIGRAMMSNPALLMLDEPSLGLSPLLSKELFQSLRAVRDAGIGILMVEQNAKQSLAIADRAYLLENTEIVHEGTAAALQKDPAVQAAYLGAGASKTKVPAARVVPVSEPRPASGPSPDDIAALALASLAKPAPRPDSPSVPAAPVLERNVPVTPPTPPTPKAPASRGPEDALLGGLSLAQLVADAGSASRAQYQSSPGPRPRVPTAPSHLQYLPDTHAGKSHDRLSAVLTEIEEAAARARAWRPDTTKRS